MKILIISQHIFPMQTPRAHRTTELMKELARRGFEVIVYAVLGKYDYSNFQKETGITIKNIPLKWQINPYSSDFETKRSIIDKVLGRLLGYRYQFPNIEFKYKLESVIRKEKNVDLLISIADPHQIHWGCARAKQKLGDKFPSKWIADCGDPYMANGTTKDYPHKYEGDERLFCELADHITVPVSNAIPMYYSEFRSKISVIPQGFKFALPERSPKELINKVPSFAFAGTFLSDIRNPKKLLEYLSSIETSFKFICYTKYTELLEPYFEKLGDKLEIRNLVPREELLENLKKMDFLLNLENANAEGQTPSKLIDYAIANRPVLSIHPFQDDFEVLNQFLKGDFSNEKELPDIKQYQIENVVDQFLNLK